MTNATTPPAAAAGGRVSRETDDLEVLESARRATVNYAGGVIEVRPLTIGQLPGFTRAARPIIEQLAPSRGAGGGLEIKLAEIDVGVVLDWIERYGERLCEACAIAVGKRVEEIKAGAPDEFLELVTRILAVNFDFFVRRLLPSVTHALGAAEAVLPGGGRTSSSS